MRKLAWLLLAPAVAVVTASPAQAIPGIPTCPGNGNDTVVLGADGGWCNFLYLPDPRYGMTHVSCRWADFSMLIGDWGGHSECRRVDAQGNLLPDAPPWEQFKDWGGGEGSNLSPGPAISGPAPPPNTGTMSASPPILPAPPGQEPVPPPPGT